MAKLKKESTPPSKLKIENIVSPPKVTFSFEMLSPISYVNEKKADFFIAFFEHLKKFSSITWDTIRTSQRHSYGAELIDKGSLTRTAQINLPEGIFKLLCLRATGNNHAFLGIREGDVFKVIFIESNFGDIYNHG